MPNVLQSKLPAHLGYFTPPISQLSSRWQGLTHNQQDVGCSAAGIHKLAQGILTTSNSQPTQKEFYHRPENPKSD